MEDGLEVGQEITLLYRTGLVRPGELRIHLRVSNSDNAAVSIRRGRKN